MKEKILISLILILVLALFVETAYLLQIRYELSRVNKTPDNNIALFEELTSPLHRHMTIDPFKEFEETQDRINDIFKDKISLNNNLFSDENLFKIDTKIKETDRHYIIKLYLPEMDKQNIKVELEDNVLVISGEQNTKEEEGKNSFYKNRQIFGSFRKVVPLSHEVQADKVKTKYANGTLVVIIPKALPEDSRVDNIKV